MRQYSIEYSPVDVKLYSLKLVEKCQIQNKNKTQKILKVESNKCLRYVKIL